MQKPCTSVAGHIRTIFISMATDAETKYFSSSSDHDDSHQHGDRCRNLVLQQQVISARYSPARRQMQNPSTSVAGHIRAIFTSKTTDAENKHLSSRSNQRAIHQQYDRRRNLVLRQVTSGGYSPARRQRQRPSTSPGHIRIWVT